jgi:hypothetical protein
LLEPQHALLDEHTHFSYIPFFVHQVRGYTDPPSAVFALTVLDQVLDDFRDADVADRTAHATGEKVFDRLERVDRAEREVEGIEGGEEARGRVVWEDRGREEVVAEFVARQVESLEVVQRAEDGGRDRGGGQTARSELKSDESRREFEAVFKEDRMIKKIAREGKRGEAREGCAARSRAVGGKGWEGEGRGPLSRRLGCRTWTGLGRLKSVVECISPIDGPESCDFVGGEGEVAQISEIEEGKREG